jgi:NAD(P)-dependent dehydrogenase (short-subunit alcohol dehydrogenase family)
VPPRVFLITGATSGIGRATAASLAARGHQVVLVGRDPSRCAQVTAELAAQSPDSRVDALVADLSLMREVRRVAAEFSERYTRLDALINNVGAAFGRRTETDEGHEMTFALNHLSPFLLTQLLLPALLTTAETAGEARVVNVSSTLHKLASINWSDLEGHSAFDGSRAYNATKLMNILFTYALARRLATSRVQTNAVNPGWVTTNLGKDDGSMASRLAPLFRIFQKSPEKGAQTSVYVATSSDISGLTGKYFSDCRAVRSSRYSYDEAAQERLWHISEQLVSADQTPAQRGAD